MLIFLQGVTFLSLFRYKEAISQTGACEQTASAKPFSLRAALHLNVFFFVCCCSVRRTGFAACVYTYSLHPSAVAHVPASPSSSPRHKMEHDQGFGWIAFLSKCAVRVANLWIAQASQEGFSGVWMFRRSYAEHCQVLLRTLAVDNGISKKKKRNVSDLSWQYWRGFRDSRKRSRWLACGGLSQLDKHLPHWYSKSLTRKVETDWECLTLHQSGYLHPSASFTAN